MCIISEIFQELLLKILGTLCVKMSGNKGLFAGFTGKKKLEDLQYFTFLSGLTKFEGTECVQMLNEWRYLFRQARKFTEEGNTGTIFFYFMLLRLSRFRYVCRMDLDVFHEMLHVCAGSLLFFVHTAQ